MPILAFLLVAVMLSGGAAPHEYDTPQQWPAYEFNAANNAVFPGSLETSWTFNAGGKINGSPAVVDDTIYIDSFSKHLFALNLRTGAVRWVAELPWIAMSSPIVSHGLVIVGTGDNTVMKDEGAVTIWGRPQGDEMMAFRQSDGKFVWSFKTVGEDMPTPTTVGNSLIFANGDMHAYSLDVRTGQLQWRTAIPGISTMSATEVSDGIAYIIASHGSAYAFSDQATHIVALSVEDGHILWENKYGNSDCSPTLTDKLVICEGSSYITYGNKHVGSMGRNDVEAYDKQTGSIVWRWVGDIGYFPEVGSSERGIAALTDDTVLYQSVPTMNQLIALDLRTGKLQWDFPTAGASKMNPVLWHGSLIFGDTAGMLYAVDAKSGAIQNVLPYHAPFSTSAPVIVGKTLFIANGSDFDAIPLSQLLP